MREVRNAKQSFDSRKFRDKLFIVGKKKIYENLCVCRVLNYNETKKKALWWHTEPLDLIDIGLSQKKDIHLACPFDYF